MSKRTRKKLDEADDELDDDVTSKRAKQKKTNQNMSKRRRKELVTRKRAKQKLDGTRDPRGKGRSNKDGKMIKYQSSNSRSNNGLLKGSRKVDPSFYRKIRNYLPKKAEWDVELIGESYIDENGDRKFITRDDLTDEKTMKNLTLLLKELTLQDK